MQLGTRAWTSAFIFGKKILSFMTWDVGAGPRRPPGHRCEPSVLLHCWRRGYYRFFIQISTISIGIRENPCSKEGGDGVWDFEMTSDNDSSCSYSVVRAESIEPSRRDFSDSRTGPGCKDIRPDIQLSRNLLDGEIEFNHPEPKVACRGRCDQQRLPSIESTTVCTRCVCDQRTGIIHHMQPLDDCIAFFFPSDPPCFMHRSMIKKRKPSV